MDKDLIEVYAHGNMLEALLGFLVEEIVKRDDNPERSLQALRSDFAGRLLATRMPQHLDLDTNTLLQSRAMSAADEFFRRVAVRLGHKAATEFPE